MNLVVLVHLLVLLSENSFHILIWEIKRFCFLSSFINLPLASSEDTYKIKRYVQEIFAIDSCCKIPLIFRLTKSISRLYALVPGETVDC